MIIVIGHKGEVGSALFQLCEEKLKDTIKGVDKNGAIDIVRHRIGKEDEPVDFMHVCIPWSEKFEKIVQGYMVLYEPEITIIHSTVPVGTTRRLNAYHSPVRGVHPNMMRGLLGYVKFYAPLNGLIQGHFESLGMNVFGCDYPEDTELLKLMSTTYYGILIAWAGEVKRMCDKNGTDWSEWEHWVRTTNDHTPRPLLQPPKKRIGGHCILPNSELLDKQFPSSLTKEVLKWK